MYAVEFFLSSPIDEFVRDIWSDLKERDITSNMANIKELTPHISVGVYNSELPIDEFLEVIMPDEMPNDFSFSLKYGVGALNEINTFEDTYTKDLVNDGTITTELKLTKKELKMIYNEMKRIELLSTIQNISYVGEKGDQIASTPLGEYMLTIQFDGKSYNAYWNDNIYDDEIRRRLGIFVNIFLQDGILSKKKEYKELPEANGRYA